MDREISSQRKPWRWVLLAIVLLAGLVFAYRQFQFLSHTSVRKEQLQLSTVERRTFDDVLNIRGNVVPARTVVLSVSEGGRLEKILVEDGDNVELDQPLFVFSNTGLRLDISARQTDAATQINNLRANRISAAQRTLSLQRDQADARAKLDAVERQVVRERSLEDKGFVSNQQFESSLRERDLLKAQGKLLDEAVKSDDRQRREQDEELGSTISILHRNIQDGQQLLERLQMRAPIGGRIRALKAEVGETLKQGDVIAHVDDESKLKIQADIDEFYVPLLSPGLRAVMSYGGGNHPLLVTKVYPNIKDGKFKVDLQFEGTAPSGVRVGQSFSLRLQLGESKQALLIKRGPFLTHSGGNYVFVLNQKGGEAEKRAVELGKKNEQYVEVLSGLRAGEQVVVSSYEAFGTAGVLRVVN